MSGSAVYRAEVRVVAPVQDTEVPDRVEDAVRNLFPDAEFEREDGRIVGRTHNLSEFSERLHEQAILDTAREQFRAEQYGDAIHFDLKKLAAFQGAVNFAVGNEDELGDLQVRIAVEEPSVEEFIDMVAPPTEDGEPTEDPF
ncbi:coaE operon protein [Halobacteriales archaeon QS_8_69_26]|nr:MAG: coaE operon protein [Halobacteriales archaeon QS_8_69_26]